MGDTVALAGQKEPGSSVKRPKVPGGKMKQQFRELKETMGSGPKLKSRVSVAPQRCAGHLALSPFSGPSRWGWWLPPEGRGRGEKEEQAAQQHAPGTLLPPTVSALPFAATLGPEVWPHASREV